MRNKKKKASKTDMQAQIYQFSKFTPQMFIEGSVNSRDTAIME